jgi:hypothetical protein
MKTKKLLLTGLILSALLLIPMSASAQVTIGSGAVPNPNAVLDLNQNLENANLSEKGLLLPRVVLTSADSPAPMASHVAGMTVYNTNTDGTDENRVYPGHYYNDGTRWVRLATGNDWFYLPSFVLDVSVEDPAPVDLFAVFESKFVGIGTGAASTGSTGAPDTFMKGISGKTSADFFYYATYSSDAFPTVSIDADGMMTYTVALDMVNETTYMNIIFVEK